MNKYLRFPALKAVYMYILWALIGSLRYFCAFWLADVTLSRESTSGEVQTLSYTNQWGKTLFFSHWCSFQHAQDTAGRREGTPNTPGSFNKGDTFESSQSFLQLYRRRARKNKVRIQKSVFFHVGWTGAVSLSATSNIAVKSRHVKTWTNKAISCSAFIFILLAYW